MKLAKHVDVAVAWLSRYDIAVNLSFVQFRDGLLEAKVQQALREAQLPAAALELELTESLLIGEGDNISRQLAQLGGLGVSFAIDDFGTAIRIWATCAGSMPPL